MGGPGLYPEHVLKSDQGNGQLTAKMTTVVSITPSLLKGFPEESLSTSAPWRWRRGGWGRGPGKPGSRAHHGLPVLLALLVALGVIDGDGQRVCLLLLLPKLEDLQHLSWEVGADMVKTPPPLLPATCRLSHGTPDLQLRLPGLVSGQLLLILQLHHGLVLVEKLLGVLHRLHLEQPPQRLREAAARAGVVGRFWSQISWVQIFPCHFLAV